jgi:hypothetical protein
MQLSKFFRGIAFVAAAASFSLALCFAIMAWSEPGQTPPGGNVAAPINTSGNPQTKSGDLSIGTGLRISSDGTAFVLKNDPGTTQFSVGQDGNAVATGQLIAPKICFGASCATQWTAGDCPGAGNYMKGIDEVSGKIICSGERLYP